MATQVQRATSIVEALLDSTPNAALVNRIGDAYVYTYRRGETLTATQKATIFVNAVRATVRQVVLDAENSQIAATAVTTANNTISVGADG